MFLKSHSNPIVFYPHPNQQYEGLHHAVRQPQQEVNRPKARSLGWMGVQSVNTFFYFFKEHVTSTYIGRCVYMLELIP